MKSMTGYGSYEVQTEVFSLSVEIKSYNNRYLDINHVVPYFIAPYEALIDERIREVASRGHVDISVRIKQRAVEMQVQVDPKAVEKYLQAFKVIADTAGIKNEPTLSDFLGFDGVINSQKETDAVQYEDALIEALDKALVQFNASKVREGAATRRDLTIQGKRLSKELAYVEKRAADVEVVIKKNLKARFDEMLGDKKYDEARFLQEVAIMLVKYSINEEHVRLATHVEEFMKLLKLENEPVAKRLEFLCQEMNREINTIGNKSQLIDVNHKVVIMKDVLEKMREQIRNIE